MFGGLVQEDATGIHLWDSTTMEWRSEMFICIINDKEWAVGKTPEEAKEGLGLEYLNTVTWEVWEMADGQTKPVLSPRKFGPDKIELKQFKRYVEGRRVFSD